METLFCISTALAAGLFMTRPAKKLGLPAVTAYLVAGILIGGLVSGRIHIKLLRKIVYAFLALSGVISLVG